MKQKKDRTVMVYFSDEEIERVEKYAKDHKWSKGSAIRYIVDGFFESFGKTNNDSNDGNTMVHGQS